jgi:hypothetical protein
MANNRLFIGNRISKKYLMISKGFGSGWNGIRNLELLEQFIQEDECVPESNDGETSLFLFTEATLIDKEWSNYKGGN